MRPDSYEYRLLISQSDFFSDTFTVVFQPARCPATDLGLPSDDENPYLIAALALGGIAHRILWIAFVFLFKLRPALWRRDVDADDLLPWGISMTPDLASNLALLRCLVFPNFNPKAIRQWIRNTKFDVVPASDIFRDVVVVEECMWDLKRILPKLEELRILVAHYALGKRFTKMYVDRAKFLDSAEAVFGLIDALGRERFAKQRLELTDIVADLEGNESRHKKEMAAQSAADRATYEKRLAEAAATHQRERAADRATYEKGLAEAHGVMLQYFDIPGVRELIEATGTKEEEAAALGGKRSFEEASSSSPYTPKRVCKVDTCVSSNFASPYRSSHLTFFYYNIHRLPRGRKGRGLRWMRCQ